MKFKRQFLSGLAMYKLFLSAFIFIFYPINAFAALCVENNTLKCDDLGYTESTCKYGGIACPFNISRWYCAEWTCEDGRYFSSPQDGMECVDVVYKDLNCFDCSETQQCTAYDEKSLNEALDCDECPVITVLNDITITDKLPDLKAGRTLKAAGGQTYTITINPTGDIQTSDPEITIDGQTAKLSQLIGTELGIILTTAEGSKIENIHFDVAATHNADVVVLALGDTTFNNLSIIIDGKNEKSEQVLSVGVSLLNPGGKTAFEGDTYVEMKNINGRQFVGGLLDLTGMFNMEASYFTSVTADNIDIRQENIIGEDSSLTGLALGSLKSSGEVTISQNKNKGSLYSIDILTHLSGNITIAQINNGYIATPIQAPMVGLRALKKTSFSGKLNILQRNNVLDANIDALVVYDDISILGKEYINIVQENNQTSFLTAVFGNPRTVLTAEYPDMPVTITQTGNNISYEISDFHRQITTNLSNLTIVQENNTIHN